MRLALVVGTRPQIIKSAPLIRRAYDENEIDLRIVHTGQHYDYQMSKIFFDELDLPDPDVNLGIGSGSHAEQTGNAMIGIEKALMGLRPDLVLIPGDTNSTVSASLAAAKLLLPQAHLEAGARIFDMRSPEEVNRIVTDHISSLLLTPCEHFSANLRAEGINPSRIHRVGDTMYDVLEHHKDKFMRRPVLDELDLERHGYAVLTLHRSENTDDHKLLSNVVEAILDLECGNIVFPMHPRVRGQLTSTGLLKKVEACKHLKMIKPLSYLDMMKLVSEAKVVITDSGGLQKEAFWLSTPCITLRERTEWVETVHLNANHLVGTDVKKIVDTFRLITEGPNTKSSMKEFQNPYGDGKAAEKALKTILDSNIWNTEFWNTCSS